MENTPSGSSSEHDWLDESREGDQGGEGEGSSNQLEEISLYGHHNRDGEWVEDDDENRDEDEDGNGDGDEDEDRYGNEEDHESSSEVIDLGDTPPSSSEEDQDENEEDGGFIHSVADLGSTPSQNEEDQDENEENHESSSDVVVIDLTEVWRNTARKTGTSRPPGSPSVVIPAPRAAAAANPAPRRRGRPRGSTEARNLAERNAAGGLPLMQTRTRNNGARVSGRYRV